MTVSCSSADGRLQLLVGLALLWFTGASSHAKEIMQSKKKEHHMKKEKKKVQEQILSMVSY